VAGEILMHDYDLFRQPAWTSQYDPEAEHDQMVRERHSAELATMLDSYGQDYAAELVRDAPTDGRWP
jgi:hypothetical protein